MRVHLKALHRKLLCSTYAMLPSYLRWRKLSFLIGASPNSYNRSGMV